MVKEICLAFFSLAVVLGCTNPRTEVIVIAWTDLSVPSEVDQLRVEATSPRGETLIANADLRDRPAPRSVGLVPIVGGSLGPYEVRTQALRGGAVVVERLAAFNFIQGQTRVLRIDLLRTCRGVTCGVGETCAAGGCRSTEVSADELEEVGIPSSYPDSGPPPMEDAGGPTDGCAPAAEICNGMDEDCDGVPDNGFDRMTDPANCGMCGTACSGACVDGACEGGCPVGFDDCDGSSGNGCEANLMTDNNHCGMCDVRCRGMTSCCDGTCC